MLTELARQLGLEVSERTAYRVQNGEIECLKPVHVASSPNHRACKELDLSKDRRGLKVSQNDLNAFTRNLESAFNQLSESYYIHLKSVPRVRVAKDKITVVFDISKDD